MASISRAKESCNQTIPARLNIEKTVTEAQIQQMKKKNLKKKTLTINLINQNDYNRERNAKLDHCKLSRKIHPQRKTEILFIVAFSFGHDDDDDDEDAAAATTAIGGWDDKYRLDAAHAELVAML